MILMIISYSIRCNTKIWTPLFILSLQSLVSDEVAWLAIVNKIKRWKLHIITSSIILKLGWGIVNHWNYFIGTSQTSTKWIVKGGTFRCSPSILWHKVRILTTHNSFNQGNKCLLQATTCIVVNPSFLVLLCLKLWSIIKSKSSLVMLQNWTRVIVSRVCDQILSLEVGSFANLWVPFFLLLK